MLRLTLKGLIVLIAFLATACAERSIPIVVAPQGNAPATMTMATSGNGSISDSTTPRREQAIEVALQDVTITGQSIGAPPGCNPEDVARLIVRFFDSYNRGDQNQLVEFFPYTFSWYYDSQIAGTDSFITDQKALLNYFAERHWRHERLRLLELQINGWDELEGLVHFGPFLVARYADDIRPERTISGKGAIRCKGHKITVWAMGSES